MQGQEKEIIILTTTVTRAGSATFAADCQRLNVALTRARRHLIVVGCAPALQAAAPAFAEILSACRRTPGAFWPMGAAIRWPISAMACSIACSFCQGSNSVAPIPGIQRPQSDYPTTSAFWWLLQGANPSLGGVWCKPSGSRATP